MFRLAHVTDPHFRSFAGARPGDFLGKRLAGVANLILVRRRKHDMELLEQLGADLAARQVDHLALTGDLSNVALPGEWEVASRWIAAYGRGPDATTVIPGNHDAYVPEVVETCAFEARFAAYQTSDLRREATYPFVRLRGEVAIVAVNSCLATGDLGAWGRVGAEQLARLEGMLMAEEVRRRLRVVLIHHPPVMHRPPESRNLRDRAELLDVLCRTGADLVLHGHDHRDERAHVPGPAGPIPVVGAGSASYAGSAARRARYNVYEIVGRRITAVTYAHDARAGGFGESGRSPVGQGS
jgi:3',5'-cyclic AMP phosphodiesterase CpdA